MSTEATQLMQHRVMGRAKQKAKTRNVHRGEEARQLKASEWLEHQNRLMAIRNGTADLSQFVVAPPPSIRAEVLPCRAFRDADEPLAKAQAVLWSLQLAMRGSAQSPEMSEYDIGLVASVAAD